MGKEEDSTSILAMELDVEVCEWCMSEAKIVESEAEC